MLIRNMRQKGVSLIEVMVVVTIMVVLALVSVSFGGQWSTDANVTEAQGLVQRGYALAKAVSLQNISGQTGNAVAATMCFNGQALAVVSGSDCTATALWNGTLPTNTSLLFAGATPSCIALTNNALLVGSATARTCTTSLTFSVTSGNSYVSNKTLY